jgi:hypothetical protein
MLSVVCSHATSRAAGIQQNSVHIFKILIFFRKLVFGQSDVQEIQIVAAHRIIWAKFSHVLSQQFVPLGNVKNIVMGLDPMSDWKHGVMEKWRNQ